MPLPRAGAHLPPSDRSRTSWTDRLAPLAAAGLLASALAGCAGGQRLPPLPPGELDRLAGSTAAEQLGTEGWIVVREMRHRRGGSDREEVVAVEGQLMEGPDPEVLRVSLWHPGERGWELLGRSESLPGNEAGLLAFGSCDGEVLLFSAIEHEPDQQRHRLLVLRDLPSLERSQGIQRDVEADVPAAFVATDEGFAFQAGEAQERWTCTGSDYEAVRSESTP